MKWIANLLADERGSISTKRVIALLSAFFLCVTLLLNAFKGVAISDNIVNAVMSICIAAMGSTTIDKFSTKKDD
jgi:hypothetical protein